MSLRNAFSFCRGVMAKKLNWVFPATAPSFPSGDTVKGSSSRPPSTFQSESTPKQKPSSPSIPIRMSQ
eukprot:scaffold115120_cov31-Tisochrysis_lutea.AAC.7